jgi:hypothetical protein
LGGTVQQDFRFTCIDKHAIVNTKINGSFKNRFLFLIPRHLINPILVYLK